MRATARTSFLGITQTDGFALCLVALLVCAVLVSSWALYHVVDRGHAPSQPLDRPTATP